MYFVFLCFYKNEINVTNKKKYAIRGSGIPTLENRVKKLRYAL